MKGKLFLYSFIYFLSFCFFSIVLHAIASAHISVNNFFPSQAPTVAPGITTPSPTLFITPASSPSATPTPTLKPTIVVEPTPTPAPTIAAFNLEDLFTKLSSEYSVDKELLKKIAQCESGFNPSAGSGDYLGMFQFSTQTWSNARAGMGLDPNPELRKNAEESIRTAAYMISRGQQNSWQSCSK